MRVLHDSFIHAALIVLGLLFSSCGTPSCASSSTSEDVADASDNQSLPVVLGDERADVYMPLLEGKRVAVFSNHSGIVGDRAEGLKVPAGSFSLPADDDVEAWKRLDEESLVPFGTPADSSVGVKYGPHILDVLLASGVKVTAIFSPEHGFRGNADAGAKVSSSVDELTGVPILSLYSGKEHKPSPESMSQFDVLVVDIQDVGLRYYTYYVTMHHLMEACAEYGKSFVVLDRPNPNGFYVDGPILDMKYKSGIGWLPIAMVHGMTLGELAQMIVGEGWLGSDAVEGCGDDAVKPIADDMVRGSRKLDLHVVPCLNYTHSTRYNLLVPPSPNLKDMKSIYLYSSTCFFEGSVVTAGRGTQWPFEIYGHPGMVATEFDFTPRSIPGATKPRYQDQLCHGVDLRGKPLREIWAEGASMTYFVDAYARMLANPSACPKPVDFFLKTNHFELQIGRSYAREMMLASAASLTVPAATVPASDAVSPAAVSVSDAVSSAVVSASDAVLTLAAAIKTRWSDDVAAFVEFRRPYLLYPEN